MSVLTANYTNLTNPGDEEHDDHDGNVDSQGCDDSRGGLRTGEFEQMQKTEKKRKTNQVMEKKQSPSDK